MRAYKYRVEFYDVDSLNVVWHGNYAKFLERARCEFLREIGFDYGRMRALGLAYPVAKMDFKFINPLFFGDEFEVRVRLRGIDGFLRFSYEIWRTAWGGGVGEFGGADGENCGLAGAQKLNLKSGANDGKIAIASTSQVCFDMKNMVSIFEAPDELRIKTKGRICE